MLVDQVSQLSLAHFLNTIILMKENMRESLLIGTRQLLVGCGVHKGRRLRGVTNPQKEH